VALQVKTATWAERERGRGEARALDHLEFALGAKAADLEGDRFLYVFVDLHGRKPNSVPDVYIVPSTKVKAYCEKWARTAAMVRWHPSLANAARYKNKWDTIHELLSGPSFVSSAALSE
jgi:hypothetical protein